MRRNCNLELRLLTSADSDNNRYFRHQPMMEEMNESPQERQEEEEEEQQQKQLTIFYNGRVFVSDVAELQARAILLLASREMEDKLRSPNGSEPVSSSTLLPPSQLYSPVGLPMKRSLQSFFQKRKQRVQATSPYNISHCMKNGRLRNSMC